MPELPLHLLQQYGYAFVALLVTLEGFGLPVPGETALVTAAALAAQGRLNLAGVMLAAALGTVLGGSGGYVIGRAGGLPLVHRYGRLVRVDEKKIAKAHAFFERHGAWTIFIGRFVAVLRVLASVLAGIGSMPFARFSLFNALGGIAWSVAFGALGYFFGRNLPRLHHMLARASLVSVFAVALMVLLLFSARWAVTHSDSEWGFARRFWSRFFALPQLRALEARFPGAWGYLRRRFTPGEYLGLHLTVGLLLGVLALFLFSLITEGVFERQSLFRFDTTLAEHLHAHATPIGIAAMSAVSALGSIPAMSAIGVGVGLILLLRGQKLPLAGWVLGLLGGGLLDSLLKRITHRPRPSFPVAYAFEPTWSFPSGHALGAFVGYGLIAYFIVLLTTSRWVRVLAVGAAAAVVLLIGYSRLYLGVHYFTDVAGGYAAGAVWLAACISGLEVARRHPGGSTAPDEDAAGGASG